MRSESSAKKPRSAGIPVSPKSTAASVSEERRERDVEAGREARRRLDRGQERMDRGSPPLTNGNPHEADEGLRAVSAAFRRDERVEALPRLPERERVHAPTSCEAPSAAPGGLHPPDPLR